MSAAYCARAGDPARPGRYRLVSSRAGRGTPGPGRMNGVSMSPHMKWGIAGVIVGLILLGFIPWWLAFALIVVAIAVPATAWLMLDESQRRRYREIRRRQRGQLR
jgi:hypothetical protein